VQIHNLKLGASKSE